MSAPEWFVIGTFIGFMVGYVYRAVQPPGERTKCLKGRVVCEREQDGYCGRCHSEMYP